MGFYFQTTTTKKSQLSLETKPQVPLCPKIHFSTSSFPLELWFDALEAEPRACLDVVGWWELRGDTVGLWLEPGQLSPNLASQWNQTVLPRKVHPDHTSHTALPLRVLMEEAGELERRILVLKWNFPPFLRWYFNSWFFAPLFPANDSWCFQTELNTSFEPWMVSWRAGSGLDPHQRIWWNKCEVT